MKNITGFLFVILLSFSNAVAGGAGSIQSFREWKSSKVQGVLARVVSLKAQSQGAKTHVEKQQFAKMLAQESWNLEITNDLSVNDYFVLYLAPLERAPNRFKEAAARLTQAEMVELMASYSRSLYSGSSDKESGAARSALQAEDFGPNGK